MANQKRHENEIELVGGPWDGAWATDTGQSIERPFNRALLEADGIEFVDSLEDHREKMRKIREAGEDHVWELYVPSERNGTRIYKHVPRKSDS